ncbi:MAG TPA: undecaprenyl-diphosphate phosphatase [Mycobacteriales bacterium]|nr:undecaprenyl-diphosphate phosphatase [Mycobacteriales bacterium]
MALGYAEACVIGALQGVAELFPVSSLGHSVLLPALIGGTWATDLSVRSSDSPYLAFVVLLHVATALALLIFFRKDWVRIIGGLLTSIRKRRIETSAERLAWLLIAGTVPVGLVGLVLEHQLRVHAGTPRAASAFLIVNGLVLLLAERLRRRSVASGAAGTGTADGPAGHHDADAALASDERLSTMPWRDGVIVGAAQIGGLLPGMSRSGVTISTGVLRGLSHEDASRFAFLLATPIILAAGVFKAGDLTDDKLNPGGHLWGPFLVGAALSFVGAYVSVKFLVKYFQTRTLTPFAIYCLLAGTACLIRFTA